MTDSQCLIYGLYCVCERCPEGDAKVRYIGQTRKTLEHRLSGHRTRSSTRGDYALARWKRVHGVENLRGVVLEWVDTPERLDAREIHWIRKLKTKTTEKRGGLNSTSGGTGLRPDHLSYKPRSGEEAPRAILADADVKKMRDRYSLGERVEDLAIEYGCSYSHARNLIRNQSRPDPDYVYAKRPLMSGANKSSSRLSRDDALGVKADLEAGTASHTQIALKWGVNRGVVGRIARGERRDLIE